MNNSFVERGDPSLNLSYESRHAQMVGGYNGTTPGEVALIVLVGPLALLLRNLAVPWLFPMKVFQRNFTDFWLKLLVDFMLTVIPSELCASLGANSVLQVAMTLTGGIVALIFFCLCEYIYSDRVKPTWTQVANYAPCSVAAGMGSRRPTYLFMTYLRASVSISLTISILAVDFPVFPRRFAKTEHFGYGGMDVGVGFIVLINAMVSPEAKSGAKRQRISELPSRCLSVVPLLVLGLMRLFAVQFTGYHVNVAEYGQHWNFFFTIASLKIVTYVIACLFPVHYVAWLLAFGIIWGYQWALWNLGWQQNYFLDEFYPRDNLFLANREGIFSLIGYTALYYAGVEMGRRIFKTKGTVKSYFRLMIHFLILAAVFAKCTDLSERYLEPPSRQMANFTYFLWMIWLTLFYLTLFIGVELIALVMAAFNMPLYDRTDDRPSSHPLSVLEPCLWDAVNYNALGYFVLANVLTGVVNVTCPTADLPDHLATAILTVYMLLNCLVAMSLRAKHVQCKL